MRQNLIYFIFFLIFNSNYSFSQEYSAYDLYKSCKDYHNWIENKFEDPADPKMLFNMGKCQGIMETTGKVMLTLCEEKKRNLSINKQLIANLQGIRTITLVKEYLRSASKIGNLQKYSAQELLAIIISNRWPCG